MTPIWKQTATPEQLTSLCEGTAVAHLGIIFTEIGASDITAELTVDTRTKQPFGVLHGGVPGRPSGHFPGPVRSCRH